MSNHRTNIRRVTVATATMTGLVALTVVPGCHAYAQAKKPAGVFVPQGRVRCAFGAFVSETDRAGLNVRSGPGVKYPVVGTLPPVGINPTDSTLRGMVEVRVTAGADGWFLIRDATDNPELTGVKARTMFTGTGWVSGRKLTVKSQARVGRERPSPSAPTVLTTRDEMTLDNDAIVGATQLVACSDTWALVEVGALGTSPDVEHALVVRPIARVGAPPRTFRAWLNKLCAVQETSCDG